LSLVTSLFMRMRLHHLHLGPISVAMAIADIFLKNRISVGRNLVQILKIFEKIDEAKNQGPLTSQIRS